MKTSNEPGSVFYFVIGVGLGLIAGLLCAPRPGREMRDELRRGALDGLDYVSEEAEKARAGADRWVGKIKNNLFRGGNRAGNPLPDRRSSRRDYFPTDTYAPRNGFQLS